MVDTGSVTVDVRAGAVTVTPGAEMVSEIVIAGRVNVEAGRGTAEATMVTAGAVIVLVIVARGTLTVVDTVMVA